MLRIILLTIFTVSFVFSQSSLKDEDIEILAKKLEVQDNIVTAFGNVIVYSLNYYITANRLRYDKINKKLELFGDVNIVKNNESISYSQYIFIDIKKDINNFKPMFVLDNTNKLWFKAKNALKEKNKFAIKNSTLSSCDCLDPAWKIGFSSGDYDTTTQWINTYNTTLYIKDIPVFYTPYFGFPTDNTRRSGLLTPTIGYSKNEGLLYAQPIYFAPKDNYDFEYVFQSRLKRGKGHAFQFRYVDSPYSKLNFDTAVFKEKDEYQKKMNLTNNKHYGWNLDYKRSQLFSSNNHSDGFILKALDMNDVDYINTKYNSNITNNTNRFLESRAKYFYNTNKYYGDIEVNMYNDISKSNNDDVMQKIPSVNLHKYSYGFFDNYLTSSVNINTNRKTRKVGVGGNTTQLYIPVTYHSYLFDEYLNFSLSEQIKYTNIKYKNSDYKDAHFAENNHVVALYSDILKPYTSIIHGMGINATYTDSNVFKDSGTTDDKNFSIAKTKKNISLGFEQSIYSKSTLKEIINHKMNQNYVYDESEDIYERDDFQNDLTYNYDYGTLSNRLIYNYDIKKITNSSTTLRFKKDSYFSNITYTYLKNKDNLKEDKNINYDLGLSFYKDYEIFYKEEYDITNKLSKKKEYNFNIDDKCWGINFKLIDSLVATDTTSQNNNSYRQKIVYMEFNLKQLFNIDQQYEISKRN